MQLHTISQLAGIQAPMRLYFIMRVITHDKTTSIIPYREDGFAVVFTTSSEAEEFIAASSYRTDLFSKILSVDIL